MKRINLILPESDKLKFEGVKDKIEVFKNVLKASISVFQNQSKGLNLFQQREALKVLDALEDCKKKVLELEDSQYTFMLNIIKNINWPDNIRLFVAVVDAFENPLKDDPKSDPKAK